MKKIPCFCGDWAVLTPSTKIYKKDYGMLYLCEQCGAYVGCHKGTTAPLGTPADRGLRKLRMECHRLFDPLWRNTKNRSKNRKRLYKYLQKILGVDEEKGHIGRLNRTQARKLIVTLSAKTEGEE